MAVSTVAKESPFFEVQRKFNGVWPLARSLFERSYGDHRNWPATPQPLSVDGYQTSVVPLYDWLHVQREGASALATLAFHPLDGTLDAITIEEGPITTTFQWFRMDRIYRGSEGSVETSFPVRKNADDLIIVSRVKAQSGNAWAHYERTTTTGFPIRGGLRRDCIYHNGSTDTPGYQRIAQLPEMLLDDAPTLSLFGHDIARSARFRDEMEAALTKTGLNNFPIGDHF